MQVLEHISPRAIRCLEVNAETLRAHAESAASLSREQRARLTQMAEANRRARAYVNDLREALREAR
ncbi:MAG TPA: hypothetical protein VKR23_16100 [Gaiellaceae bacterium]|nr:hypothetical protein [Gaiellaceae bacterium]